MELRQLHYFTTVVASGSFTAAAAALHMSQPPLSVSIAKLEREVGVSLLVRTPRGVEPTSAGRYLLDAASRIQGDVDEIISTLRQFGQGTVGSLTLAAVPVLNWFRIPQVLRSFALSTPEVEIRLVDPPPWQALDMLENRTADIAAVMVADHGLFAERHRSTFRIIDWGEVPLVAALPPGEHSVPDPLPLSAFAARDILLPRRTAAVPSLPEAVDMAFSTHGITPRSIRTTETILTGLPLVEAGLTSAILPDPDGQSLDRFNITRRAISPAPPALRALLLVSRAGGTNPMVERFIAHVVSDFGATPLS